MAAGRVMEAKMLTLPEFEPFPKIARLSRECVITEKIDGANAQVYIGEDEDGTVLAGSRSRWLRPEKSADNFGFAAWVEENREELRKLGPGRHFGEWWGAGIQRGYGLTRAKIFSLFNVARWSDQEARPACCSVVPVLYRGLFSTIEVERCLLDLQANGSHAARGFMKPEGIVIFHAAAAQLFKKTLENDASPKERAA